MVHFECLKSNCHIATNVRGKSTDHPRLNSLCGHLISCTNIKARALASNWISPCEISSLFSLPPPWFSFDLINTGLLKGICCPPYEVGATLLVYILFLLVVGRWFPTLFYGSTQHQRKQGEQNHSSNLANQGFKPISLMFLFLPLRNRITGTASRNNFQILMSLISLKQRNLEGSFHM